MKQCTRAFRFRNVFKGLGWLAMACAVVAFGSGAVAKAEDAKIDFNKEIAPILAASCVKCHGPERQKAKLRLDSPEAINAGSENGPVLVAGKPGESTLCKLISLPADHPDRMPVNADPLNPEQVALIAKWIEQGAAMLAAEGAPADAPAPAPTTEPAAATGNVDFSKDIYPIFVASCVKCHGPEKQKGELRLDSIDAIKAGGENGPIFVAGKPAESSLCVLISKPKGDPDIMPANGDPLTPEQIALVAKWIEQGAVLPETLPDISTLGAPAPVSSPAAAAGSEAEAEAQLLAKLADGVQPAAAETIEPVKQIGGLAMPLDLKSPLLSVNLQYGADKVNDEALAKLAALAPQVTWLNLAGTKVTDAGLAQVANLKKITRLHLERTEVTDAGIANLAGLENLQYLNVYGTKVSDASIDALQKMASLKKLYVWNSQITKEGADKLKDARPDLYVNIGIEQAPPAPAAATAGTVDFAKDIAPILQAKCYGCHGPEKQAGKLRLDLPECITAGGASGPAVLAGKPGESPLCVRVHLPKEDEKHMPKEGEPLTAEQLALVAKWITEGAVLPAKVADAPAPADSKPAIDLALFFEADGCCAKAKAAGKDCDHPCCAEAKAKGEVCAKCNAKGAKLSALVKSFDADGCCAKAIAGGKPCDHPCCVEAVAKGELCAKCNPNGAITIQLSKFDKDSCCAKSVAEGRECDHPCCAEARAKGEVCAKCNPSIAKAKLTALFDADSCCSKALAASKDCEHPCCVEARGKGEACTKCNPGAAEKLKAAAPPGAAAPDPNAPKKVASLTYNRFIHPILADNCFTCHGPDKNARKGDLRLDVREAALETHEGRAAIVPGNSGASELVRRITSSKADDLMPPTNSGHALKPEQIAALTKWIDDGAEYEPHWSYLPVVRPEVPSTSSDAWSKNPVDRFVLANLDVHGLKPSPEADRITLIRRASLDLIGLPPTPDEVDAFVNDTAPDAYEKLIDRLLASPQYGERMAVSWLDWVRYADTNGYHGDEPRIVWPYRDYVIKAFNENMPFDRFTIEQLAGDLLPNATREQKIASGYNRLNQLTAEGGAQAAEYVQKYMADRIRTTTSVWMGSTFGCAECHDHKFDPTTMKDFYSLGAFFADVNEKGVYTAGGPWDPTLPLPDEAQAAEQSTLESSIASLEQSLDTPTDALAAAQQAWEAAHRAELAAAYNDWTMLLPESVTAEGGATPTAGNDLIVTVSGADPATNVYNVTLPVNQPAITGLRLELFTHPKSGKLSRAGGNGNIILSGFDVALTSAPDQVIPIASAQADYEQPNYPIAAALDADPKTGWAVSGHEVKGINHFALFTFAQPIAGGPGTKLIVRLKQESEFPNHTILKFRLSATTVATPKLVSTASANATISAILLKDASARTVEDNTELAKHYRSIAPELEATRAELKAKQDRLAALNKEIPTMLVANSISPREVKILPRGNFLDTSGDVVQPATPHYLPQLQITDRRANRLDLAQWLVSRENPVTARTTVNRFWEMYFGSGLSKVLDDLGARGEWPVNADTLDWLSAEFMDSGWDVKHIVRLMVTSATYRQSSSVTTDLNATDPFNRLYARQSTYRLAAEEVRDSALRIAGLLSPKLGGRTVFPYQPDGYYADCNTFSEPARWLTSPGEDQYRRGLYTFWKRSFLHPSMLAFDAPTREECTAERVISNTPLQALALLNDPSYVEASRVFAEHIMKDGGATPESRIQFAFRRALSRNASADEIAVLTALCKKHYDEFSKEPDMAKQAISVGQAPVPAEVNVAELAAWTSVARTILNLHETITRT
ncbi:MAG: DUF1553 domain-containing protein [Candidatus Hydrogenedentes bacterium]|nr:DUF1553 domain-containing protein [Candidatus Hydrogenedentota bacterium]